MKNFILLSNLAANSYLSVLASTSCESSIDVIWIELEDHSEIINGLIYLTELLICTASGKVGTHIILLNRQKSIAIFDSFVVESFLHIRRSTNKQCFLMIWFIFELFRADVYQIVNIDSLRKLLACQMSE